MNLIFRPASISDALLIQQLANTIWLRHYPGIISIPQIEFMLEKMYSSSVIINEIEKGYHWIVVLDNNQPIGFIEFHFEEDTMKVKLSKLYILLHYHGKGVGQAALEYVKKQTKLLLAHTLYLTVNKMNSKAIAAYKKAGFIIEREMKVDIGNNFVMDDYLMSIQL